MEKIVLTEALSHVREPWRPKVVGELNGQVVQLARLRGEFVWHRHDDAEELFLGLVGRFVVETRERVVEIGPGELVIVPRGVEHRTRADEEACALLFEPAGTRNTGDVVDARLTAPTGARLERGEGRTLADPGP